MRFMGFAVEVMGDGKGHRTTLDERAWNQRIPASFITRCLHYI
jgi:hypothetical protein